MFNGIDAASYLAPPPPLNGTCLQHCCSFCGECQWSVGEEEVEGMVAVEEMREECWRGRGCYSQFEEVKRLWREWEDEEEEEEKGFDSQLTVSVCGHGVGCA